MLPEWDRLQPESRSRTRLLRPGGAREPWAIQFFCLQIIPYCIEKNIFLSGYFQGRPELDMITPSDRGPEHRASCHGPRSVLPL